MGSSWGSVGGCSGSLGAVWVSLGVPLADLAGSWRSLLGVLDSLGSLLVPKGAQEDSREHCGQFGRCFLTIVALVGAVH